MLSVNKYLIWSSWRWQMFVKKLELLKKSLLALLNVFPTKQLSRPSITPVIICLSTIFTFWCWFLILPHAAHPLPKYAINIWPNNIFLHCSSSRSDKLSGRSSQLGMRNPPSFIRTPSRRYQRRIVEGASEGMCNEDWCLVTTNSNPTDLSQISMFDSYCYWSFQ